MADEFEENGVDLKADKMVSETWEAAEKAKIELSSSSQTEISNLYIYGPKNKPTVAFGNETHKGEA